MKKYFLSSSHFITIEKSNTKINVLPVSPLSVLNPNKRLQNSTYNWKTNAIDCTLNLYLATENHKKNEKKIIENTTKRSSKALEFLFLFHAVTRQPNVYLPTEIVEEFLRRISVLQSSAWRSMDAWHDFSVQFKTLALGKIRR